MAAKILKTVFGYIRDDILYYNNKNVKLSYNRFHSDIPTTWILIRIESDKIYVADYY